MHRAQALFKPEEFWIELIGAMASAERVAARLPHTPASYEIATVGEALAMLAEQQQCL